MFSPRALRTAALAVTLVSTYAGFVWAQCPSVTALSNGASVAINSDPRVFSVTPSTNRWSAVGVRGLDGLNWDIEARDATAAFPTCFSGLLATSTGTGLDFVVTDWRHRSSQTDYIGVATPGLNGTSARVEYEQSVWVQPPNAFHSGTGIIGTDLLLVFEVQMSIGTPYRMEFWTDAGMTGFKAYVFEPVTSGSGWLPRSSRAVELALVEGGNGLDYYPTSTGTHAVVITNELGQSGNLYFAVRRCPFGAAGVVDDVPFPIAVMDDWYGFTPPTHSWGVFAAIGDGGTGVLLDAALGMRDQTQLPGDCTDSLLVEMTSGDPYAYIIAGDFRVNPLRLYTTRVSLGPAPSVFPRFAYAEWDHAQNSLQVNGDVTLVTPPDNNVVDAWNIDLFAGPSYHFELVNEPGATAIYSLVLFGNPSGGTYWATRHEALFNGQSPVDYVAPNDGTYCLAVVKDNHGTGGYTLSVTSDLVDASPGGIGITGLRHVSPNPSTGPVRIEYELARPVAASVRVTDVAGRTVAEISGSSVTAGVAAVSWDGLGRDGRRVPAGVYFVTLHVDGVPRDRAKLLFLR